MKYAVDGVPAVVRKGERLDPGRDTRAEKSPRKRGDPTMLELVVIVVGCLEIAVGLASIYVHIKRK